MGALANAAAAAGNALKNAARMAMLMMALKVAGGAFASLVGTIVSLKAVGVFG